MDRIWEMGKQDRYQIRYLFLALFLLLALPFFAHKYIPLVPGFLAVLAPVSLLLLLLTAWDKEKGIVLFVFLFPLLNSLPYFFNLFEHIPQAPIALVLFLFFFMGWSLNAFFSRQRLSFQQPLLLPMTLFSFLIILSGLITFFRYSGNFPFTADKLYEFVTNVNGVTSGGAFMSTLFNALNYLTGFALFFVVYSLARSDKLRERIQFALIISAALSILMGFAQRFFDLSLGNTPFWIEMDQINGTFKDPNALAVFLSAVWPLALGFMLARKGTKRWISLGTLVLILLIFPQIGNRSGFLGLIAAALVFLGLWLLTQRKKMRPKKAALMLLVPAVLCVIAFVFVIRSSRLGERLKSDIRALTAGSLLTVSPERYFLWKEAANMIRGYPLTGIGLGAYIIELPNYYSQDTRTYEHNREVFRRDDSAENYSLQVTAELGLIGSVFVFWIFAVLMIQVLRSTSRSYSDGGPEDFIRIGITAGLSALGINYLFHSYIGCFEAKYIFWILAALLVSQSKAPGKTESLRKVLLAPGIFLILIYGGVLLHHSLNSLALENRAQTIGFTQDFGWYDSEQDANGRIFRWSKRYAGTMLDITEPEINFSLLASHPDLSNQPVCIKMYLVWNFFTAKTLLKEIECKTPIWHKINLPIPYAPGRYLLLFEVSRTWNPQKDAGMPDSRDLGVALSTRENIDKKLKK